MTSKALQSARFVGRTLKRTALVATVAASLSGCVASIALDELSNAPPAISAGMLALMAEKSMTADSPVLIRIFKKESELEVWKVNVRGQYALLKTYPMCRWSGKLGPKKMSGDRQAPEGFYHVSAGMLNPRSQYYLSFNLGYPNRLEAALGYSGEALMVHGACSSSGCYAMTDQGVGEIYALVAKALASGQNAVQVQAYPFRMTPENLAGYRNDENMAFWRTLKEGYDAFNFSRQQPKVSVCGGRYVFNTDFPAGEPRSPLASCPPGEAIADAALQNMLNMEARKVEAALADKKPSAASAYADGGMHTTFRTILKQDGAEKLAARVSGTKYPVSRPEAALADPFQPAARANPSTPSVKSR